MKNAVRRRPNQQGFSLIELVVVVGIVGVLSAIGISSYGGYKEQAVDGSVHSSLRSARTAMEAFFSDNGGSYVGVDWTQLVRDHGFRFTEGVEITFETVTPTRYVLRACASGASAPSRVYDSDAGAVVADSGDCS